jgi:hypothetical protein
MKPTHKITAFLLFSLVSMAGVQAQDNCDPKDAAQKLKSALGETPDKKIESYAKKEKKYKVIAYNLQPTLVTPVSVSYDLGYTKIKPGECVYLKVPEQLTSKAVLFINLGHQQQEDTGRDYSKPSDFNDNNPGLTSVQLSQVKGDAGPHWRYWNGPSSGDFGAKFAEADRMELEGLYEWYHYGHKDVETQTLSKDLLMVDGARLCSVGKDPVTLGSFAIKVAPEKAQQYEEVAFSKSHRMGDMITAQGRSYGSRSDALFLDSGDKSKLPAGWQLSHGTLTIPAKKGMELKSFEATIGDSQADGSPGGSSLNVRIHKADGTSISIIDDENIPPAGVLLGAPYQKYVLQDGDKIELEAWGAHVMGLRLGYSADQRAPAGKK